ncbi:MAG TPA: hypothetical protein VFB96_08810 [Pirellulaceae bacterium]|nr:hypothetical protein [Pirellulaceae bacterium]
MKLRLSRRFSRSLASVVIWVMVPLAALAGRPSTACVCADGRIQSLCPLIWPIAASGKSCCLAHVAGNSCCDEHGRQAGDSSVHNRPGNCCRSVLAASALEVRRTDGGASAASAHGATMAAPVSQLEVDAAAHCKAVGTLVGPLAADLPVLLSRLTI